MKKSKYPEDDPRHIRSSIVAFNGYAPIEHFKDDDSFLMAWRARQIKKHKIVAVRAFDELCELDKDQFYQITRKLRSNITFMPGELRAFGFLRRVFGLTREEIIERLK